MSNYISPTPWDSRSFDINTYEIHYESDEQLEKTLNQIANEKHFGHFTIKINPLESKRILHKFGFYYCDTLIEPYCIFEDFVLHPKDDISLSETISYQQLAEICHGAFFHGRFHRDFNLDRKFADLRYNLWLKDLWESKQVFGLIYFDEVAGFFGVSGSKIVLHALSEEYRGKGLSKYFWSCACQALFERGYKELKSSISASNMAVLNLYSSLGFKFRNPIDVYHKLFTT